MDRYIGMDVHALSCTLTIVATLAPSLSSSAMTHRVCLSSSGRGSAGGARV
jgi:hypothetical protein